MFNPKSLINAYSLAQIQEESVLANRRAGRTAWNSNQFHSALYGVQESPVGFTKGSGYIGTQMTMQSQPRPTNPSQFGGGQPKKAVGGQNQNQALVPVQKVTQAQMEERRRKCYSCDSKWSRGHVCSVPKLFLIETLGSTGGETERVTTRGR
jgi:hypothetical protein